ncbi:PRC-barrel domain-containing protein [Candidatus Pacearchaeota archaeon]|nr:PRC-barrel domain-containing protein [Candidatus Pacearchaeota archaeon]
MLKIRKVSEIVGMKVFTDGGDYFGEIEEANLVENKIDGWRIRIAKDSSLAPFLGGARGLIVPHQFVKAVGDVIVVSKSAVPSKEEAAEETEEETA